MLKKIWTHRLEFYPYFSIFLFWFCSSFLCALAVKNRPGIFFPLGLISVPAVILITIAFVKTYKNLPPEDNEEHETDRTSIKKISLKPDPAFDRKFKYIAYGIFIGLILCFTYLHHFQPQVLNVPSNTDVSTWSKPSFEETLLFDRMTDEDKANLLAQGVPFGDNMALQLFNDVLTLFLGWFCWRHARKNFGFWMASCFLIGSFVFTGIAESTAIITGRFLGGLFQNPIGEMAYGTYWFTRGFFWFIECPILACVGWFFIAYTCVLTAGMVFPNKGVLFRALIGGLIAMDLDLWLDPVATSPEWMNWVWGKADFVLLFGIPIYNFIGWFLVIFVFAILWEELPKMQERWGRAKASIFFFCMIVASDVCCTLIITIPWVLIVGNVLAFMGVTTAIRIPAGW